MRHSDNMAWKIADVLRQELETAGQGSERSFFSSRMLAGRFNCSHQTVNNALNILAGEGLLERKYGSGSWSCRKRERLNIACMINDDFSLYHHKIYSRELFIVKNLLEILDENLIDIMRAAIVGSLVDDYKELPRLLSFL